MKKAFCFIVVLLIFFGCQKNNQSPQSAILRINPSAGAEGTYVYIYGSNFDTIGSNNLVSFNGINAPVIDYSGDSLLIVQAPAGVTTGKVTVSSNNQKTTSSNDFVVLPGSWTQKKDFPDIQGRLSAVGFSIGDKGYIGFGGHTGFPEDGLFMYDPSTDSWSQQALLGIKMQQAIAVTVNNKAYLGIGFTDQNPNEYTNQFFEYNPVANTYTAKSDFPGAGRFGAVGIVINNKIYVGLGNDPKIVTGHYNDLWQYDPVTDVWTRKADAPAAAEGQFSIAFSLDDSTTYICSGSAGGSPPAMWLYNANTDSWTQKNNLPFDFSWGPCTMVIGTNAYVLNGWDQNWLYNPSSDTWTQKAFFTSRMLGVAFVIGNKGYFGLGSGLQLAHANHDINTDIWEFNP
jgi:N-acetylneuraminic acid mutarotase